MGDLSSANVSYSKRSMSQAFFRGEDEEYEDEEDSDEEFQETDDDLDL